MGTHATPQKSRAQGPTEAIFGVTNGGMDGERPRLGIYSVPISPRTNRNVRPVAHGVCAG